MNITSQGTNAIRRPRLVTAVAILFIALGPLTAGWGPSPSLAPVLAGTLMQET